MTQKCLILYTSRSGNTEKVANVFKDTFTGNGWQVDMLKVTRDTDPTKIPLNYQDYDFMCVGSPVFDGNAPQEIINAIRKATTQASKGEIPHEKIAPGPKKGIVFATYSGAHLGPKEAAPALSWLEVEMEHQKFRCIGSFCCPGEMKMTARPDMPPPPPRNESAGPRPSPETWWHGDITGRPNEKDLLKAKLFIEDKLEEIAIRHAGQYPG